MTLTSGRLTPEKTLRDVMTTELVTLKLDDTLRLADDLMVLGNLRHFPVLEDGKIVGMLNQSDLLKASIHSLVQHREDSPRDALGTVVVKDVMKPPPVIPAGTSLKEAARIMVDQELDCVLVLDGEKLVGLATRTDLLRAVAKP